MKFTTTNQQLKEALKRLGFAINNKSSIMPVIANILVTVTDGAVLLTTTYLMVTINYQLTGTTSCEGQFLIPFTLLKNITALEEGEVTIELGLIWKMFRELKLQQHGLYMNLKTMEVNPIKITA